jgi:hypothetical protein
MFTLLSMIWASLCAYAVIQAVALCILLGTKMTPRNKEVRNHRGTGAAHAAGRPVPHMHLLKIKFSRGAAPPDARKIASRIEHLPEDRV